MNAILIKFVFLRAIAVNVQMITAPMSMHNVLRNREISIDGGIAAEWVV